MTKGQYGNYQKGVLKCCDQEGTKVKRYYHSLEELAATFDVSEMTIRRDLNTLQTRNMITLVHGAAIYNGSRDDVKDAKYELHGEKDKRANEKYRIGRKAVSLIKPNDVIIIDTGTTTEYVAKLLSPEMPLTVLCYTTNTLVEMYKNPATRILFSGDNSLEVYSTRIHKCLKVPKDWS